jgi:hypothetical protein
MRREFALQALGVKLKSEGPRDLSGELVRGRFFLRADYAEYVLPRGSIGKGLPETEHVMNVRGMDIQAEPGTEVLVYKVLPYFDRTYQHFCSHRQTPSSGETGGPAVVKHGRVIYFANPIFTEYHALAPRWEKRMFLNALDMLLPEPLVRHTGPTTMQVTVNEQADENRWVVHVLHYIPERRSQYIDIIEDVIPLYDVRVAIRAPRLVQSVTCVPQMEELEFESGHGYVEFVVPRIEGHQMVTVGFLE